MWINMKIKISQEKSNSLKAIGSIAVGTATGLASYIFFLYFNIAIFGWNLGLIFAPLIAGYVETELANEYIGESIGAVSAFILFIVTVVYGFIINNPTLGANVITVGSLIVIAQAAVPILINYILILVFGVIFYYIGIFKKITDFIYYQLKKEYYHKILKKPLPVVVKKSYFYNDIKRCHQLNSSDFVFLTTTEPFDRKIEEYMGPYVGTAIFEIENTTNLKMSEEESKELLNKIKNEKDNAILNLAKAIEKDGGHGVLDLRIEIEVVGMGFDEYQITALGIGVKFQKPAFLLKME